MNTCKSCKWWEPLPSHAYPYSNMAQAHHCEFINSMQADRAPDSGCEIIAFSQDDTGLDYFLQTGSEFYCPNHEELT